MKVAFIGVGNMGAGIARCILRAGFPLAVWNRTASKAALLVADGATLAPTPGQAALGADLVVSSLMDDRSVLETVQGPDGVLAGLGKNAVHACVTTISPSCSDELERIHAAHGSAYVSAPVVGRPDAAATGQLMSYLAGPVSATTLMMPVCQAYSRQVTVVSTKPRVANCLKLAINYSVVSTLELIGETYVFAEKCGIPLEHLRDFYQQAWFAHPAARMYAEKLRARDFAGRGGFVMTGGLKDVSLMLSTASAAGVQLEIGQIVRRKLDQGIEAGMSETDWSAFYEITRRESGLT